MGAQYLLNIRILFGIPFALLEKITNYVDQHHIRAPCSDVWCWSTYFITSAYHRPKLFRPRYVLASGFVSLNLRGPLGALL